MVRLDLEMERSARLAGLVDAIRDGIPFRLRPLVLGLNRSENTRQLQSSVVKRLYLVVGPLRDGLCGRK